MEEPLNATSTLFNQLIPPHLLAMPDTKEEPLNLQRVEGNLLFSAPLWVVRGHGNPQLFSAERQPSLPWT